MSPSPALLRGDQVACLAARLAERRDAEVAEEPLLGLVLPSLDWMHLRASNWNRRVWQDVRKDAGLPELHFRDLRHFFVSHVSHAGLPPALVQQLVGHADDKTHGGYTPRDPDSEPLIRDGLDRAFAEKTDEESVTPH